MNSDRKGKLILKSVPGGEVERKVVAYLTPLMKNISPELLAAKVKKAPLILSRNITAEQGLKIAARLKQIGATAAFVPHAPEAQAVKSAPVGKPASPAVDTKPKIPVPCHQEPSLSEGNGSGLHLPLCCWFFLLPCSHVEKGGTSIKL